jgi:hypothetical protein
VKLYDNDLDLIRVRTPPKHISWSFDSLDSSLARKELHSLMPLRVKNDENFAIHYEGN